jgi:GH15 family glucan-1,4-alpha-glucosidase
MNYELYSRSINIIRENQSNWGSYIASPAFPTYHFCWLRDGSFIAHAMDKAGEYTSAEAYFRWVSSTLQHYGSKVEAVRIKLAKGLPLGKDEIYHTRFSLDGKESYTDETWGNFQIDGYGTWLWALAEHVRLSGNPAILNEVAQAVEITVQYLALVWQLPNYDCWEEHSEYIHPYSLAAVYAGLEAVGILIHEGKMSSLSIAVDSLAAEIKNFVLQYGVQENKLVKMIVPATTKDAPKPINTYGMDASLIAAIMPYGILPVNHPVAQQTMQAIESDLLRKDGGVYRYLADVYYGGGEWLLLTAWLGWYFVQTDRIEDAEKLLGWIESCADENGNMPEQVSQHVLFPEQYQPWLNRWGPIAKPLLWSHAMYIILVKAIEERKSQ